MIDVHEVRGSIPLASTTSQKSGKPLRLAAFLQILEAQLSKDVYRTLNRAIGETVFVVPRNLTVFDPA